MNHTPGPWTTFPDKTLPGVSYVITDRTIAVVDPVNGRANAALIAAAPDLLDALESVMKWIHAGCDPSQKSEAKVRSAIAKANGGLA